MADQVHIPHVVSAEAHRASMVDIIDRLSRYDGPPEQFLKQLLTVQCQVASAEAGAMLRVNTEGRIEILSVYPPAPQNAPAPPWLGQAAEWAQQVFSTGKTNIRPLHTQDDLYGTPAKQYLALVPLLGGGGVRGMGVFVLNARDAASLAIGRERLEVTCSLVNLYEMRLTLQNRQFDLRRLRLAMETLSAVHSHKRFTAAGMALCNEVAARWQADRVSLGFLKGRYVYLKSLSHTEKFSRKMKLVQEIETAMEECLDQDLEVCYPPSEGSSVVCRATSEHASKNGLTNIVSMPLRRDGEVQAVLMVERPADKPFLNEEIESLRLTCELVTNWLVTLHEQDRWFGAKAAVGARKLAASAVGTKHTWIKLVALGVCGFIAFAIFGQGKYQAEADFVIEPQQKRIVPAPFEGQLKEVFVEPGNAVTAGMVLATLRTDDLENQLSRARSQLEDFIKQEAKALAEGKFSEQQQAAANCRKVQEEINIFARRLEQAQVVAPVDGFILRGDLKRQIGAPLKTGDVLFEVAPLDSLRAELSVPEDQIVDVAPNGQKGELATKSFPKLKIAFTVERVNPVAEVVDQDNVFKVWATFDEGVPPWLRPGMKGVAKVELGRRSYGWLWTHRLVNWVRMKLWV